MTTLPQFRAPEPAAAPARAGRRAPAAAEAPAVKRPPGRPRKPREGTSDVLVRRMPDALKAELQAAAAAAGRSLAEEILVRLGADTP